MAYPGPIYFEVGGPFRIFHLSYCQKLKSEAFSQVSL